MNPEQLLNFIVRTETKPVMKLQHATSKNLNSIFFGMLSLTFNMSQDQFLNYLFDTIQKNPSLDLLIDKKIFFDLREEVQNGSWSSEDRVKLIKNLQNYIETTIQLTSQICSQTEKKKKFETFGPSFGEQIQKLEAELVMRNQWLLYTLNFSEQFSQYTFDLNNTEQISKMVHQVKYLCVRSLSSIFYISSYFVRCCQEQQKKGVNVSTIIKKLQKIGKKLKEQFSVLQGNQKQKQYMKKEDESAAYERHLNFQAKYYKEYTFTLEGTVAQKQIQLEEEIMNIVEQAKQQHHLFKEIVYSCCTDNKGYGFKSNLKLKSKDNKSALHRVKEKLFKNQIDAIQSQIPQSVKQELNNCQTISQRREKQKKFTEEIMNRVLQEASQVPFTVTDILRGKCLFNKVAHINQAVSAIVTNIRNLQRQIRNIQLIEIDNRLQKITRDIVLKIRIGNVVAEFQLVIFFVQAQNEIHHKMYQLGRSKIKSSVSLLYEWNEQSVSHFFQQMEEYIFRLKGEQKRKHEQKLEKLKEVIGQKQLKIQQHQQSKQYESSQISRCLQKINKKFVLSEDQKILRIISSISYYFKRKKLENCLKYKYYSRRQNVIDAKFLLLMGNVYTFKRDEQNAIKYYESGLKLGFKQQHQGQIVCADIYHNMGNLKYSMQKQDQAIQFYNKSLQIKIKLKDDPNVNCANTVSNIGMIYQSKSDFERALKYYNQSLGYERKMNLGTAYTLENIGIVYRQLGKYQQALDYYNQSYYILEVVTGKHSLDSAQTLNSIGVLYQNLGKDFEALDFYYQVLYIRETLTGKNSIQCSGALNNIGNIYKNLGKYQEGLKFMDQSLRIKQKHLGKEDSAVAISLNNIGIIYQLLKKYAKAEECFIKSLKILEKTDGKESFDYANSLQSLANLYQAMEKYDDSLKYLQQAKSINLTIKGKDITYAIIIKDMGSVHQKQEKYEQALSLYNESKTIIQNIEGQKSINFSQILKNYGSVHEKLNKDKQALNYYNQAQNIIITIKGKNSLANCEIIEKKICIQEKLGNKEQAQILHQQLNLIKSIL